MMRTIWLAVGAAWLGACQAELPEPGPANGGAGAGGVGQTSGGGGGGSVVTTAGASGTVSTGGAGGAAGSQGGQQTGGAVGGGSGVAGAAGAAGGGGSAGAPTTFACSQLTGPNVAGEWFDAGFEDVVGDAKWQVKAPHHSFVEDWANPEHDVWRDSDCQGTYTSCETKSKCDGAAVDRVLFVTQIGEYLDASQATWEERIEAAMTTFKAKYPGLKRVELLTFVRSPEGQNCGGETTVAPALDAAHAAIAAASQGFVTVGPHLTASACALFSGPPHMNAQGNSEIAAQLALHYE